MIDIVESNLYIHCRLGQACNHIAALLFYIEHYASHDELPYDLSKTSKAMTWNQPPKKEIKPAQAKDIEFVKPSHGDINEVKGVQSIQRNQFDPRHSVHRVLNPDKFNQLLKRVHAWYWISAILENKTIRKGYTYRESTSGTVELCPVLA